MYVISIFVSKRFEDVEKLQKIFTKYGENIKTRLGVHDIGENKEGLILIVYNEKNVEDFINEIKKIENITVNNMKIK